MLPVAIVGGGPIGLVSSILLSLRRIPHRVFEQYPGTSIHPKACGLNQRTVEIFRHIGVEPEIIKHRAPQNVVGRTGWFTGVGPTSREIWSRDAWGGGKYKEEYKQASPVQYSTLAQIRLEPILQQRALQLNRDAIQYNSTVTRVVEQSDHVALSISHKDGSTEDVQASFVLGADGGRGLAESLGIGWEGESDIVDMVTAHFRADITSVHPDPRVFISWLINPRLKGSRGAGYLYHLGPYYPNRERREEWVLAAPRHIDDPIQFDRSTMVQRIRRSLELPDLDVDLISVSQWTVNARVTNKYRSAGGRVFLVGDACHRVPPWGALGMNSGIQDAHNLIWKLGLALKDSKSTRKFDGLLDTYEAERKPIAVRVARNSLNNMRAHADVMDAAVGIHEHTSTDENLAAMDAYFDPNHAQHAEKQAAVRSAAATLDHEFHAPGIEIGWFYPSADVNNEGESTRHDGQIKEDGTFNFTEYHPSTIPGHSVPHAWLQRGNETLSTRDLIDPDGFVLLTCRDGLWDELQSDMVDVHVIDGADGEKHWRDRDAMWARLRGVEEDGAVLVRPDGIVAWRAQTFEPEVITKFASLMDGILKIDSSTHGIK